jgi:hypothetical protein
MSMEQMQPLELTEDRLDKLNPRCSHLGKCFSENISHGSQKGVSAILSSRKSERGHPETWYPVPSGDSQQQMDKQIAMGLWGLPCKY